MIIKSLSTTNFRNFVEVLTAFVKKKQNCGFERMLLHWFEFFDHIDSKLE